MAPERFHTTGFSLKILAILGMTANHIGHAFLGVMPLWGTFALYSFGGLTFPIMAFLIIEGYLHTSNVKRYAIRLGVFALISQWPFSLLYTEGLNVFFTLLVGLIALLAYDRIQSTPLKVLAIIGLMVIDIPCDWGPQGVLIILLFYMWREQGAKGIWKTMSVPYVLTLIPAAFTLPMEISRGIARGANAVAAGLDDAYVMANFLDQPLLLTNSAVFSVCNIGYALIGYTLAAIALCRYNGQRGRPMKWFFYVYYPLHLVIVWAIRLVLFP